MHGGISPSLDSLDNIRQLDRIQEADAAQNRAGLRKSSADAIVVARSIEGVVW